MLNILTVTVLCSYTVIIYQSSLHPQLENTRCSSKSKDAGTLYGVDTGNCCGCECEGVKKNSTGRSCKTQA